MAEDTLPFDTTAADRAVLLTALKVLGGAESAKSIYDFSAARLDQVHELRDRLTALSASASA